MKFVHKNWFLIILLGLNVKSTYFREFVGVDFNIISLKLFIIIITGIQIVKNLNYSNKVV